MEMVGLFNLFDDNNLTIGRGYHDAFGVLTGEAAGWAAEEIDEQRVYCSGKYSEEYEHDAMVGIGEIIGGSIGKQPYKESDSQLMCSLLVETYFT